MNLIKSGFNIGALNKLNLAQSQHNVFDGVLFHAHQAKFTKSSFVQEEPNSNLSEGITITHI